MRVAAAGSEGPAGFVEPPPDSATAGRVVGRQQVESFDAFFRRTYPGLLSLARALVGPGLADDVAQEAMLAVYGKWGEVARLQSPSGWARRVCLNKAVSLARRRSVERRALGRWVASRRDGAVSGPTGVPAPEAVGEDEWFWSLVRRLPARQAQAVALHYALDLSVAEVAEAMGCSAGSVKVHLSRARASLAALVQDESEGRS